MGIERRPSGARKPRAEKGAVDALEDQAGYY